MEDVKSGVCQKQDCDPGKESSASLSLSDPKGFPFAISVRSGLLETD